MATISTSGANRVLDMSNPLLVQYFSTMTAQPGVFSYIAQGGGESLVQFLGSGLTYSGSPPSAELSGGTITGFELDVDVTGTPALELSITGLTGVNAAAIDKDNARTIWNEVLNGRDVFDLTGLDADQVGVGLNVIFGDDLEWRVESGLGVGRGARDWFQVGDNRFEIAGDVLGVSGSETQLVTYAGRGDRMVSDGLSSDAPDRTVRMAGDAGGIDDARLIGGDDRIIYLNCSGAAVAAGDVRVVSERARVIGGNDKITVELVFSPQPSQIAGDVLSLNGDCRVDGGDDLIRFTGPDGGEAGGDVFTASAFANVNGGADTLTGSSSDDVLAGDVARTSNNVSLTGGDDLILGGAGDDILCGEAVGSDGFGGSDAGVSTRGNDTIYAGSGDDTAKGQSGDDLVIGGGGKDALTGGEGNDSISGDAGRDSLDGNSGDDTLLGGDGADELRGRKHDDILDGGDSGDYLWGGEDADELTGGSGRDRFDYNAVPESSAVEALRDRILDFTHLVDVIDLADIDAKLNGSGSGGNNAFTFIGQADFTQSGQIRVSDSGGDALVEMNVAGQAVAEMALLLVGVDFATITEDDFVL